MRRPTLPAVLLVGCLTFSGGLVGAAPAQTVRGADDPEATVGELLDAVAAGDAAALDALVCESQSASVRRFFDVRTQLGIPGSGAIPALTFRVSDRDVGLVDDLGELATVHLGARLSLVADDAQLREVVRAMLESGQDAGSRVSDADLQAMAPLVAEMLAAGQAIDADVTLLRDSDGWLVCGGLGERGERADDLSAAVSFDGLCGLVSVAEMSALGPLEYDSSTGADAFCTYSLSSYEDDHTATVNLDQGFRLEDLAAVAGEVEQATVDGQSALVGAGQLAVQIGEDDLRVEVDLGSDAPAGLDALEQARRIASLFIPVVGSYAEMEPEPQESDAAAEG